MVLTLPHGRRPSVRRAPPLMLALALATGGALPPTAVQAESYGGRPWRYGNWGGAGYSNGREDGDADGGLAPVDELDRIFRTHDRAYAAADRQFLTAYREAFARAAREACVRLRIAARWKVRDEARRDREVNALALRWRAAYEAADRAALQAIRRLADLPSGIDPRTGRALPGQRWLEFTGRMPQEEVARARKRREVLQVGNAGVVHVPPIEEVEAQVVE